MTERRSAVDLVPTLLDLFRQEPTPPAGPFDFLSGRSLLDDIVSPKGYQADDDRAREEAPNTAARLVGSNKGVLMEASHEISAESGTNRKTIYDVGVLVVHGIGQQRKSETVNSYAGAMYEWVRDRLRGSQEDHAHRNSPGNAQQTNPPHT